MPPSLAARALWALVALLCVASVGAMLILPAPSKVVDLVYGAF
jgi:hypothetical protein